VFHRDRLDLTSSQVFILCSAWDIIFRPPKGGTTSLRPPSLSAKTREKNLVFEHEGSRGLKDTKKAFLNRK